MSVGYTELLKRKVSIISGSIKIHIANIGIIFETQTCISVNILFCYFICVDGTEKATARRTAITKNSATD